MKLFLSSVLAELLLWGVQLPVPPQAPPVEDDTVPAPTPRKGFVRPEGYPEPPPGYYWKVFPDGRWGQDLLKNAGKTTPQQAPPLLPGVLGVTPAECPPTG